MNKTVSHTNSVLSLTNTVTTTTNCHTTGPRVSKDANRNMCLLLNTPNTRQIVFFKLAIHHNFIFMWNIANKKIDAAGNSDAGGDDSVYETIVCKNAHLRIGVCLDIIDKE